VVLVWIAVATQLAALSSVTQGNNAKFLPASAPSQHAADLVAPFGTANLAATPVVAARSGSALATADLAALTVSRSKIGFRLGGLQVFRSSGGVRVVVDQAVEDRFSADPLSVDFGHGGAGTPRSPPGTCCAMPWRGRAAL
jgi:hypothetical protein